MISNWRHRGGLLFAAAYALLALSLTAIGRHYLDAATVVRMNGVLMGALLVAWANTVPKQLIPLAQLSCDPAREQALRRFAGWVMVLGGLGYALAYALAPIAIAATLAICLLAPATAAVAIIVVRCAWLRRGAN